MFSGAITGLAQNNATVSANCGASALMISGNLSTSNGNRINILIYKDNAAINSVSDIVGPTFSQSVPLSGSGSYYALVREVNNDRNGITSPVVAVNCSSSGSNPSTPSTPSTGGSLAFQILSYDCNSGVLQYKFTGGDGSPVSVVLPGIFGGTMNANTVANYTFPSDGRVGRTVTGWAIQSGNQIPITFTNGCNMNTTTTTTTTNPTSNPPTSTGHIGSIPAAGGNFAGYFDGVDCSRLSGWVLNRNTPNQSTKFDIYVNGWLVARNVPTDVSRQDVANAYGISGYNTFGFNIALPNNYKVGVPLTVSVKYAGTSTNIPGSPKTTAACQHPIATNSNCTETVARLLPGSEPTHSASAARTGVTSLQLTTKGVSRLTSRLIPVRQSDNVSLDVYAFTPALSKPNLTPQITSAIVGGVVGGIALAQRQVITPDHGRSIQTGPAIGFSSALMVPLIKSLVANRLPNATAELAFYDKKGRFIHRHQVSINKTAHKGWQLLHIDNSAPQDGFAVLRLQNHNKVPVYFDDISIQIDHNGQSKAEITNLRKFSTNNGLATQVDTNEQNVYQTMSISNCGDGSTNVTYTESIFYDEVNATVTAPAPNYGFDYDTGSIITVPSSGNGTYNNSGGAGGGGSLPKPYPTFTVEPLCCTLKKMWQASLNANGGPYVEVMALITSLGTLVMPTSGIDCSGTFHANGTSSSYSDYFGKYVTIVDVNGKQSQALDLCDGTRVEVYGAIHTHPSTAIGNPFQPSPADLAWATSHPGIITYLLGASGLLKYDEFGNTYPSLSDQDLNTCICP